MRNKAATFWLYIGNHDAGMDHLSKDPHGFGLGLIAAMFYWARNEEAPQGFLNKDLEQIRVVCHRINKSDFGYYVTVSAPPRYLGKRAGCI